MRRIPQAIAEKWRRFDSEWDLNRIQFGASTFGWTVISWLVVLLGVSTFSAWILSSYYEVDIGASMAFNGVDGNCDETILTVGAHCFSDYAALGYPGLADELGLAELLYPMSSRILRLPFLLLQPLIGVHAATAVYVVVSVLCVLLPIAWAVRNLPWIGRGAVLAVAGVAAAPALFVWDRGNILSLTVPFLFLVLYGLVRDRPWLMVIGIIAAASIKPQFALLAFLLVVRRQWLPAVVAAGGSVALVVGSFAILGPRWFPALGEWVGTVTGWSSGARALLHGWPTNVSFERAIYFLLHVGPWGDLPIVQMIPDGAYTYLVYLIALLVVIALAFVGRRIPPLALGAVVLAILCLSVSLSFGYYQIFALPVLAIALRDGLIGWSTAGRLGRAIALFFGAALVMSITPLLIPDGPPGESAPGTLVVQSLVPVLGTMAWAIFVLLVTWSGIAALGAERRSRRTVHDVPDVAEATA